MKLNKSIKLFLLPFLLFMGSAYSMKNEDKNNRGLALLDLAAANGHLTTVEFLVNNGANISAQDNNGYTPLHNAAARGHTEIVQLLLDKDAKINVKNTATINISTTDVDLDHSIDHFFDDNTYHKNISDAICHEFIDAIKENLWDEVMELLRKYPDLVHIAVPCDVGWTALHWAARTNHVKIAELLIRKKANIYAVDLKKKGALEHAVENGYLEMFKLIVENAPEYTKEYLVEKCKEYIDRECPEDKRIEMIKTLFEITKNRITKEKETSSKNSLENVAAKSENSSDDSDDDLYN